MASAVVCLHGLQRMRRVWGKDALPARAEWAYGNRVPGQSWLACRDCRQAR
ncbi:MAG: hypothetical protein L3J84_13160 [Gammaproteobacteria bacterium]|nr:hypothetical protein [Gammaproteobacteria bacterium]